MDSTSFDALARFTAGSSRRQWLKSALVASAAGLGVVAGLDPEGAEAKKKGGKKRCKKEGKFCSKDKQCCKDKKSKLICDIPFGAGNSDKACCRGKGAQCSRKKPCCTGSAGKREFECVQGVCQPFVEEL